ncbi:MAG: hypothetical protein M1547_08470 [Gammaproteobacteria bacterium]|nr:hypothetical protein [Gammaproteobacteria bacterium]
MIIGIVSDSDERHRFYEGLLFSHTVLHYTPDEVLCGRLVSCDGFLLDAGLLSSKRKKLRKLLKRMGSTDVSAFISCETSHLCIVRHDPAGGLGFQCGRVAAAGSPEPGLAGERGTACMHTLVFQDTADDCAGL